MVRPIFRASAMMYAASHAGLDDDAVRVGSTLTDTGDGPSRVGDPGADSGMVGVASLFTRLEKCAMDDDGLIDRPNRDARELRDFIDQRFNEINQKADELHSTVVQTGHAVIDAGDPSVGKRRWR